jgi:hypothetical protein
VQQRIAEYFFDGRVVEQSYAEAHPAFRFRLRRKRQERVRRRLFRS